MTHEAKVGWIAVVVVIVLALLGYAIYAHEKQAAIDITQQSAATTTPLTVSTGSSTVSTASSTASVPAKPATPPKPTVSSDGTVLFVAPNTITLASGKGAVETTTGFRIMLQHTDGNVAAVEVNTGSCNGDYCTSRSDTAKNIQFSTGEALSVDGYTIKVLSVSPTSASFRISAAPTL